MPDLKHVSPKVECFVISSLSGKAGADTDQGSGCRLGGGAVPPDQSAGPTPRLLLPIRGSVAADATTPGPLWS